MSKSFAKKEVLSETIYSKITMVKNNYFFNIDDVSVYKEMFENEKEEGVFLNNSFNDMAWVLCDINDSKATFTLNFAIRKDKNLNVALKCSALNLINKGYSCETVSKHVSSINKICLATDNFSKDKLDEYVDIFMEYSPRSKEQAVNDISNFFDFYNDERFLPYKSFIEGTSLEDRKIRELPPYENILKLDYIIDDFFNNTNQSEKLKYYPILIWWKLTTIIPLRPQEFLDMKYECISYNENTKEYWITVPRKKSKLNKSRIPIQNTLKITKEMYELIDEYRLMQKDDEKGEYLFSYYTYRNSGLIKTGNEEQALERRNRLDKIDKDQMRTMFKYFYRDIVENLYKEDIVNVKMGDTRHLAFCNMMLQGLNMLSIARIGGHENLQSQVSYSSHLDYFAEARVRILSEQIKKDRFRNIGNTISISEKTEALIVRSKLYSGDTYQNEVQDGFCIDKSFPDNCIEDCDFCDNYILNLTKKDVLTKLRTKSDKISKEIELQIATMQNISQNMFYDTNNLEYSMGDQEELLNLGNKLNRLFSQKASVEANIDFFNENRGGKNE